MLTHQNEISPLIIPSVFEGKDIDYWSPSSFMSFVGLAPVRLLRPSMAVLYHVKGKLQRAYSEGANGVSMKLTDTWPENSS